MSFKLIIALFKKKYNDPKQFTDNTVLHRIIDFYDISITTRIILKASI